MRAEAERQLAAYLLQFPDETARLAPLQAQIQDDAGDLFSRSNMRGHITTSAFVLDPGLQQILLIHHATLKRWLQPGGHHGAGQALWDSALREVREETGLARLAPHPQFGMSMPLDIDTHAIPANPCRGEPAHWHHDYAYLVIAAMEQPLLPQPSEVDGVAWRPLASLADADEGRLRGLANKLRRLDLADLGGPSALA